MIEPQQTQPRLLVVGNMPVAQALVTLGKAMSYHVIAVDLDNARGEMSHADEILTSLDEIAGQIRQNTFVVVTTHSNYDELALEKVLKAHPTYVGLVASPKRARAVRDYLALQGLSEAELLPPKAPAGLDIQARRGDEIALSIMAEIVQRRRNAELVTHAISGENPQAAGHSASGMIVAPLETTAVDLICGMKVDIASAKYTHEHAAVTFYFCSAGCRVKFAQNPAQYLGTEVPSGESIDPVCLMTVDIATTKYMSEYDGKLIYFCSPGFKGSFDANPMLYIGSTAPGGLISL